MKKFLAFSLVFFTAFNLNGFCLADSEFDYKSMIQKNFNPQPIQLIQKNNLTSITTDYVSEIEAPLKNYKLGVGDVIQINLISKDLNIDLNTPINPEGKIFIPKIGEFYVNNLAIEELKAKISKTLSKKISNFELSAIISKIRNIKITLTGYANKTGSYTIPQFTRLLDFLKLAEGINENASYRNIEITSIDNKKKTYDLYDFIYKSKLAENPHLKSGDTIHITPILNKIALTGNVLKSGIYEIKEKENILENLAFSGAFTNNPSLDKVIVWKKGIYNLDQNTQVVEIKNLLKTNIESGDIIFVPYSKNYSDTYFVHLYGQINKQGSLQYRENFKLSDYIKLSGGVSNTSDLENVRITRVKDNKAQILMVNINDILFKGEKEKDVIIEPDDIIFIPEKFFNFRNFNDITSVMLSTLGVVSLVISFIKQ